MMDLVCASVPGPKAAHTQALVQRFSPAGGAEVMGSLYPDSSGNKDGVVGGQRP